MPSVAAPASKDASATRHRMRSSSPLRSISNLPLLGQTRTVRARARAVVDFPAGTQGLQVWFLARLRCLLDRVPGIRVVSGYRTRAAQARLHEERPELAAPPGRSMHERGLAADLAFPSGTGRHVILTVAADCGLGFPVPGEPWHVEAASPIPPRPVGLRVPPRSTWSPT